MAFQVANNLRFRRSFGRIRKIIDLPYLIEIQKNSYDLFLQKDVAPPERQSIGLQEVFNRFFRSRISTKRLLWSLSAIRSANLNMTSKSVINAV